MVLLVLQLVEVHVLYFEVMVVIFSIEYVHLKGFKKLWLEYGSSLLYQAFCSTHIFPFLGLLKIDEVSVY